MKSLIVLSRSTDTRGILHKVRCYYVRGHHLNSQKCDCEHHSGANLLPPTPIQPQYLGDRHAYHDYIQCNVNTGVGPSLEVDIVAATMVFPVPSSPSVADWPALKHGGDEERKC